MWGIWITIGIVVGVIATFTAFRSERTRLAREFNDTVQKVVAANASNIEKATVLQSVASQERIRGDQWRDMAMRREKRIEELTNRLLRQANVPSMENPDAEDSPTVAQADARAAAAGREPLEVRDGTVEPPPRLTLDRDDDDDEAGED